MDQVVTTAASSEREQIMTELRKRLSTTAVAMIEIGSTTEQLRALLAAIDQERERYRAAGFEDEAAA